VKLFSRLIEVAEKKMELVACYKHFFMVSQTECCWNSHWMVKL